MASPSLPHKAALSPGSCQAALLRSLGRRASYRSGRVAVWVSRPPCRSVFKRNTSLWGGSLDYKCLEDHEGVAQTVKLRCGAGTVQAKVRV